MNQTTKINRRAIAAVFPGSKNSLLRDELCRAERDVFIAVTDVAQQLVRGPVMQRLPENVGQRNGKCDHAAEPDIFFREVMALRREHQPNKNTESEKRRGMFVFQAKSQQQPQPEPKG